MAKGKSKDLTPKQRDDLFRSLKVRFEKNMSRHKDLVWSKVQTKLEAASMEKLWSLHEMEISGGEPDLIVTTTWKDKKKDEYLFCDCAAESPAGRRSICYDPDAFKSRKENKPKNSAMGMADAMGIEILNEEQYRELQRLGNFDMKTSSWIATPPEIRKLSGAIFADYRYGKVFVYHNGAESYYAARGFRGSLKV